MPKKFTIGLKILLALLFVISAITVILIFITPDDAVALIDSRVSIAITWAFTLLGLGAVSILAVVIKDMITSKEAAFKALLGIIIFAIVFGAGWLIASPEIPILAGGTPADITPKVSRLCGMGLWSTYILGLVAIVASVYSNIARVFK